MRWHRARDEYDAAITYARRWLALDPLHDGLHYDVDYANADDYLNGRATVFSPVGPGYGIEESLVLAEALVKAGVDVLDRAT